MSKLAELLAEIDKKAGEVKGLFEAVDARDGKETPEEKERIVALNKEIEELEKRAADTKEMDDLRSANDARLKHLREPATSMRFPGGKADGKQNGSATAERKTLGQRFVESEEWQGYFKTVAPTGQVGQKTRVQSPSLVLPVGLKTVVTGASATSAGALVETDVTGIFETLGRQPLVLRDIISIRQTGSDLVEFVRMVSRENAAAMVAEATATAGSTGTKPEGGFVLEVVQAAVKTVAEWVPATKRALSDAGQLRGIIDDELRADLNEELEEQILNGDGTGENFTGLDAVSGTQDQAWDTNILTTTRKARTLVRTVGRAVPNAYVLNPTDWETIDLLQDNEARYFFGGPSVLGNPRLWGLPVVESEEQAVGFGWVGDFRKAVLWDREQFMVSVSDSHSDFFIRNLVAVLGELRAAFGVLRPAAFVEMDLTA